MSMMPRNPIYDPPVFAGMPHYGHYGMDLELQPAFLKLKEQINAIEDRLMILRPNEVLQEKYPALKEAYEHYKLVERLVNENHQNGL